MYNTKFLHDEDGSKTGRASIFDILFYSIGTAETRDPSAGTIAVVWRGAISEKMTSALRKRTRDDNNVSY